MVAEYSDLHVLQLVVRLQACRASLPTGFRHCPVEVLAEMYNGIGPSRWPAWARRAITWAMRRLEAPALVHDFEWSTVPRTYWNFTASNLRIVCNGFKTRAALEGLVAGLLCQAFGWLDFKAEELVKWEEKEE